MSNTKKAKTAKTGASLSELEQSHAAHLGHLAALRSHLSRGAPGVPAGCPAARAVLRGIDEEVTRSTREYRLRRRFERERIQNLSEANNGEDTTTMIDDDDGWQDVTPPRTSGECEKQSASPEGGGGGDLRSSPELMEACSSEEDVNTASSPLGQALAGRVTRAVADAGVRVSTPVAAVALALHAAMRTDVLGFRCTGIPDDDDCDDDDGEKGEAKPRAKKTSGGSGGFAAPIRELPKTKFLPDGWDDNSTAANNNKKARICLRYRKDGVGATILRVTEREAAPHQPSGAISITVTSSTNSEPTTATATAPAALAGGAAGRSFDASQHVNLAGLAAAITSERTRLGIGATSDVEVKVSPVLHYLDLAGLMTTFVTSFDLGSIRDPTAVREEEEAAMAAAAGTAGSGNDMEVDSRQSRPYRKPAGTSSIPPVPTPTVPGVANPPRLPTGPGIPQPGHPPRIADLDPSLRRPGPGGDFGGDLAPGGILDPSRGRLGQEDNRGSLMGPNHPAFRGPGFGGDDGFGGGDGGGYGMEDPRMPHIGGTGMAPRFDPYYPPGVGPDLGRGGGGRGMGRGGRGGRGRGRRPPPSGGDPNPDHLRPPNSFNGDMFM